MVPSDDGPATSEALALWLQPDSPRVHILSLPLVAGSVPRSVVNTIAKLCPSAELRSLRDIKHDLSEPEEQALVEVVQKGPRKQACLLHQLKSKCIMAAAMGAVIRQKWSKQPLVEWSSSRTEKRKDVRTIRNLFFKDVLGDSDAVYDSAPGGIPTEDPVAGADERGKVLMLLGALHPITVMESDYLHVLLADMYQEYVDVEVLTYHMIGRLGLVRARDDMEVKWWR